MQSASISSCCLQSCNVKSCWLIKRSRPLQLGPAEHAGDEHTNDASCTNAGHTAQHRRAQAQLCKRADTWHADDAPLLHHGQPSGSVAEHEAQQGPSRPDRLSLHLWLLTFCSGIAGFLFG